MAKNKKNKHNIWKRLNFKYRLSAVNENTLEEIWKIRASIFSGAVLFFLFAGLLVTVTSIIIITTPIRYYLPGYMDSEIREKAVKSAIKIDSLEQQIGYQEAYLANLRSIFAGTRQIDSVRVLDTISVSENDPLLRKTDAEKEFVERYREEEKYNLSSLSQPSNTPMEGVVFFKPVRGIILKAFTPAQGFYGIVIKTGAKETVATALEGTIISTAYDIKSTYTVQIQHKNGFVSIYKGISMLLKKTGDRVKTGEAIAVIDENKATGGSGALLEFELWYRGLAVNPEDYITF